MNVIIEVRDSPVWDSPFKKIATSLCKIGLVKQPSIPILSSCSPLKSRNDISIPNTRKNSSAQIEKLEADSSEEIDSGMVDLLYILI
jgi:hypothetical protein